MGRERGWQRKHLCLYLACLMILSSGTTACTHLQEISRGSKGNSLLESAKSSMAQGDYETSLRLSEDILKKFPRLGDAALYQIGLIYLHSENKEADEGMALEAFKNLLENYPESNKREDAEVWVFALREMIDRQQAIDSITKDLKMIGLTLKKKEELIDRLTNTVKDRTRRINQLEVMIEGLKTQIGSLETQIDRLKSVDIGIEKQKRESLKR